MFPWMLENTVVAALVALATSIAIRNLRVRPAIAHLLWLVALAVLLMPRLPVVRTPGHELRVGLRSMLRSLEPAPSVLPAAPAGQRPSPAPIVVTGGTLEETSPALSTVAPESLESTLPLPRRNLEVWGLAIWAAGALFVVARAVRRIAPFHRLVRSSAHVPVGLVCEVDAVARQLGVRRPRIRAVRGIGSPSIWCLGRPTLLWPAETAVEPPTRARAALIAHELAHLARKDHWVSWLEIPVAALAWWNPLFWWIRGRVRHFAELACDAWAVWAYPADRRAFAEALIDLQARSRTAAVALQGLGATDSEFKDFERRLDMIMQKRVFPGVPKAAAALAISIAVLASPGFSGGGDAGAKTLAAVETRVEGVKWAGKARQALEAKDDAGALAALEQVVKLDPDNGWAHGRLGYLLVGAQRYEEAKPHFQRQFELGDSAPTALYNMACAQALSGNVPVAIEYLAAAVRNGFADNELMVKDADLATVRHDPQFRGLVGIVYEGKALRAQLATLEKSGAPASEFLAAHGKLSELLTGDGKLQAEHGHMALKAGDTKGAALAFGRQIEARHDVASGHYNRACALSLAGDVRGAMADLRKAVELGMAYADMATDADLDNCRAVGGYENLQALIVEPGLALKHVKELVAANDVAKLPELAAIARDEQRSAKQRAWVGQAVAKLQLHDGQFADAYASFEQAAALGYEVQNSAFGMAQALAAVGKDAEARRHVEFALDLGFADPDALKTLLASNALAAPADAEAMVARATQLKAKLDAKGAYKPEKVWAQGLEKKGEWADASAATKP